MTIAAAPKMLLVYPDNMIGERGERREEKKKEAFGKFP